jgi:hypothetical protein
MAALTLVAVTHLQGTIPSQDRHLLIGSHKYRENMQTSKPREEFEPETPVFGWAMTAHALNNGAGFIMAISLCQGEVYRRSIIIVSIWTQVPLKQRPHYFFYGLVMHTHTHTTQLNYPSSHRVINIISRPPITGRGLLIGSGSSFVHCRYLAAAKQSQVKYPAMGLYL